MKLGNVHKQTSLTGPQQLSRHPTSHTPLSAAAVHLECNILLTMLAARTLIRPSLPLLYLQAIQFQNHSSAGLWLYAGIIAPPTERSLLLGSMGAASLRPLKMRTHSPSVRSCRLLHPSKPALPVTAYKMLRSLQCFLR